MKGIEKMTFNMGMELKHGLIVLSLKDIIKEEKKMAKECRIIFINFKDF